MIRRPMFTRNISALPDEPLWYKDAIIYEVRTRSFADSDGDGIGDLRGLASKLDYLQDLGVSAVWLLPICPSPGRDDGYDISEYHDVHPEVGTLEDFKYLLAEAHRRGIRIITELVMNHTSDQHPWFQRARRSPPGSPERDFYVWSETQDRYSQARIIFKDFEVSNWTWDPIAKAFFWHRFYSHQPDLNFENPVVQEALFEVVDFWLSLGVDGLRLDAVPYLYEREGTTCENLPETHVFLKKLRARMDEKYKNRMLLAEANQWPEDAALYFGDGDECHMNFHFPIMPRLFMSIHMEDRFPIIDILAQTPVLHPSCQWAMFLRNHDELTLEMVTDEERDYMYRAYAHDKTMRINLGIRRRLAPLVANNRRRIELMNGLLFSLPGTPVIYYGDEIGMGDNVYLGDRNGVRTPMQWSADRNAGFSRANPQRLILPIIIDPEYHYEAVNVEMQQDNPSSLLWFTKRLIDLRRRHPAFGRGSIEMFSPDNPRVLAFVRRYEDEVILVIANLSRQIQFAELDLHAFKGMVPVELFGRTPFPALGDAPFFLTLGEHEFYWFALQKSESPARHSLEMFVPPTVTLTGEWRGVMGDEARATIEDLLPGYLYAHKWLGVPGRVERVQLVDAFTLGEADARVEIAIARVEYMEGETETFALPLAVTSGTLEAEVRARAPQAVLALISRPGVEPSVLFDAFAAPATSRTVLDALLGTARVRGRTGELVSAAIGAGPAPAASSFEPRVFRDAVSAVVGFGGQHVVRYHRRLDEGVSADLDIGRFLAAHGHKTATPAWTAALSYRMGRGEPSTVATLQEFVPAESDAWAMVKTELRRFYERVLARNEPAIGPELPPPGDDTALLGKEPPPVLRESIGEALDWARLLGRRVAELHVALTSDAHDLTFAPEPYSSLDQRGAYQGMRNCTGRALRLLRTRLGTLSPGAAKLGKDLLGREADIYRIYECMRGDKLGTLRGRQHGNLHLEQILFTGKDFVIVDFEGPRDKPISERRRKRGMLRDVAVLLRSYHYAAFTAIIEGEGVRTNDRPLAEAWGLSWYRWVASTFLEGYLATVGDAPFLPRDRQELGRLLGAFVLERAFTELASELEKRSPTSWIPLLAIAELLDGYKLVASHVDA